MSRVDRTGLELVRLNDSPNAKIPMEIQPHVSLLKLIGPAEGAIVRYRDWDKLTCADLQTLDRLWVKFWVKFWVKYSRRRFGFSLQKSILASANGFRIS